MTATSIEWTHIPGFKGESWNPIVGCDIVSKGCTHCYAMKMAARLDAMSSRPDGTGNFYLDHYKRVTHNPRRTGYKPVWTGKVNAAPDSVWEAPLRAKKPRCYFVNSMGDVFHEDVPDEWIDRLFAVMALSPQHRFLILTKRPERTREYMSAFWEAVECFQRIGDAAAAMVGNGGYNLAGEREWPLPNVWLGTSVEDQVSADQRIPHLLATPAALRFVSAEPLLGPVDLTPHLFIYTHEDDEVLLAEGDPLPVLPFHDPATTPMEDIATPRLDWVIAGGESGPDARPCHPDWLRGLRDQCAAAQVPFFFKQWGSHSPDRPSGATARQSVSVICADGQRLLGPPHLSSLAFSDAEIMWRVGKTAAGHELDGQTHHAWPAQPASPPPVEDNCPGWSGRGRGPVPTAGKGTAS